jgi:hypothetical protein
MKTVIIDDGVDTSFVRYPQITEAYQIFSNGQLRPKEKISRSVLTHGTICAEIMGQINQDIELIDFQILNKDKRASIDALVAALTWCHDHSVKLIHMSLGTLNYHDYSKMIGIIKLLLAENAILVAAYHNKNLKSFPASIPGVFGVRSDKTNQLQEYNYAIDFNNDLFTTNCFIAAPEKSIIISENISVSTVLSNSFAAPVITGYISLYLQENNDATHEQVLSYLLSNAKSYSLDSNQLCSHINEGKWPILSLVIGIRSLSSIDLLELYRLFKMNDYYVEIFSTSENNTLSETRIPLDWYCTQSQNIDKNILYTLDYIYKTDAMLVSLQEDNSSVDWTIWDAIVKEEKGQFILVTESHAQTYNTLEALYNGIVIYF